MFEGRLRLTRFCSREGMRIQDRRALKGEPCLPAVSFLKKESDTTVLNYSKSIILKSTISIHL